MSDFEGLLAAKAAADAALADAESALLGELATAKAAHREAPTPDTKARKDSAVGEVQAYRAVTRQGRDSHAVGGDAYVVTAVQGEG